MWKRTWLFKVPHCENYEIQESYLQGPCVVQIITTTYRELCTTGITFVGFSPCGYRHVSSNYHLLWIVHHRYHVCRVLPCVDTDMFLQTTTYWELCTTGITFVGFLPCVDTDMFLQTTTYWELCTTGITFVGFLPSVDTDMFLQSTTFWELCTTRITFVWFMPSVDTDMCLQITTLWE